MKRLIISLAALMAFGAAMAEEPVKKIENLKLEDLRGEEVSIPYWGEKNLMIFYVDPDRHKQNEEFTYELEQTGRAGGDNIVGFGVLNLKDTMLPNGIIRSMARKRTEKNKALVLADKNRILSKGWDLGDCNNKFVLMLVSKEGELVFIRKGELTEADKEAFYKAVEPLK
ncbi:MAG: hypothetical protein II362_05525 [Alistipes sp.]|nr:hypothetical protein [Alistipes sp.]MBQ1939652.1 hypothetical protein [Alistipes sp.]MBQ2393909.1 hypothetical protein [Alistipes sp.]MBQ5394232.1 hypothetical protein [Alistipes sp.]MBQ5718230.1 hypothetical protein [Alistipes sp.]